jgi:hypothetical protein
MFLASKLRCPGIRWFCQASVFTRDTYLQLPCLEYSVFLTTYRYLLWSLSRCSLGVFHVRHLR